MFEGRTLIIATKHAKERVIAPLLEDALGVHCATSPDLDTDLLGTFTGEIERKLDPLSTAREKCRLAMESTGADLAVASEGSFGPHPTLHVVPGDEELLVLVDRHNDLELVAREVSAATNFASAQVTDEVDLIKFAETAGFPDHGLILRKAHDSNRDIHKGITDRATLLERFRALSDRYGTVCVETDMRANFNPSRMTVIEDATRKLVSLAGSACPNCGWPGFRVTEVVRGLPCELCGLPTNGASRHISVCRQCEHSEELRFPNGKTAEDPMYCEFCNP